MSDDDLIKLAESTDPNANYRMPMSIGEPHAELDKGWLIFLERILVI